MSSYVRADGAVVGALSWDRSRRFSNLAERVIHTEATPDRSGRVSEEALRQSLLPFLPGRRVSAAARRDRLAARGR